MNVRKKLQKRFKKFIFWFFYMVYISALVFSHCTLSIAEFLGPSRPRKPAGFLGMMGLMGLMGFLLAKARIFLKVNSVNLSCDLIVLSGTLARQSSPAALLAPSLTFLPDSVGTLAILLLAWKMRKI